MDRSLIEKYAADAPKLRASIAGLNPKELDAFPIPGTWSIRQIVVHMLDSDLIAADRMKRVAAEDQPTLIGYNETLFAKNLPQERLDLGLVCEVFEKNRLLTAELLRGLPDESYQRTGNHNESGVITLEYLVKTYVNHLEHHLGFIRKKRALLG